MLNEMYSEPLNEVAQLKVTLIKVTNKLLKSYSTNLSTSQTCLHFIVYLQVSLCNVIAILVRQG